MAYLHCHNCDWGQDDFWDWKVEWSRLHKWSYRPFGYNPLSLVLEDIAEYVRPRYVGLDSFHAEEMGWPNPIFSWRLLRWNLSRHVKQLFTQTWWTYEGFIKDNKAGTAKCPGCGSSTHFDID